MAQLAEDGTYPGAETIFAQRASALIADFDLAQPRDPDGRWTNWGGSAVQGSDPPVAAAAVHAQRAPPAPKTPTRETPGFVSALLNLLNPIGPASAEEIDPEEENRGLAEESLDPTEPIRVERYEAARNALKEIDPQSHELEGWSPHGYVPTEADIARLEAATKAALAAKADLGPPSAALPAIAAANGRLEPSPPGLVFSASGHSTTAIGDSYSEQVREFYGAVRAPNSNEPGAVVPDGLFIVMRSDGVAAIEAKYVQNWLKSPVLYRSGNRKW